MNWHVTNVAEAARYRRRVRGLLSVFIMGLVVSGITAFPLETELRWLSQLTLATAPDEPLGVWLQRVYTAVHDTNRKYPFMAYGTDWLAFAHMVIAIAFIGPLKDPVRNVWVIEFGMIACVAVFPTAFIAGAVRGIPIWWRLIDCSFGVAGAVILWQCLRVIRKLPPGQ